MNSRNWQNCHIKGDTMRLRQRKLLGLVAILLLLIAYPLMITGLFVTIAPALNRVATLLFFVLTGLLWAVPAGLIIKWMSRPDRTNPTGETDEG